MSGCSCFHFLSLVERYEVSNEFLLGRAKPPASFKHEEKERRRKRKEKTGSKGVNRENRNRGKKSKGVRVGWGRSAGRLVGYTQNKQGYRAQKR